MSGNAMLTMKRSRLATNVATETRVRTCQRRCISQGPYTRTGRMQVAAVCCRGAVPTLRWPELLDRRRFEEIRRNTGVATNILSDRLRTLVEHDVLEKRETADGAEYVPTRKAVDVNPVLVALLQWGDAHAAPHGPPRVLVHARCGHDAEPALHCSHCEQEIGRGELRVRPGE